MNASVLRYSNVYGPRQDVHGEAGVCAIFTGKMLANESVSIFGGGSQLRDYVYVEDLAQANLAALDKGAGEAINIGTGIPHSTLQVFETLAAAIGYAQYPQMLPGRPGEVQRSVLDVGKAERELGWKATTPFAEGIARTVAWVR